jgi:flagellar protein FliT
VNAVQQFYDATVELISLLENDQLTRDEKLEQTAKLLAAREGLMQQIKPPFSAEEEQLGRQLTVLNRKLQRLLEEEKVGIQRDMITLKKQKETNKKYTAPYESLITVEGGFYDKRK